MNAEEAKSITAAALEDYIKEIDTQIKTAALKGKSRVVYNNALALSENTFDFLVPYYRNTLGFKVYTTRTPVSIMIDWT